MITLITGIAKFHGIDLDEAGARLELAHPDQAGVLTIKRAGPNQVTVARRLDLKAGLPDVEVTLFTGAPYAQEWAPVEYIEPAAGIAMMTVELSPDASQVVRVRSANQAEITRRAGVFAATLQAQNWLENSKKLNT
jgi:hypothetical protein